VSEAGERVRVVAEARSWIRTPYHLAADVKGAGVDCGMLLVRAFCDTGLAEAFDPRPYPPDWHLHRSEERYLGFVFDHAHRVDVAQPGDVAVFQWGRCYSHGGIVTSAEPLTIVHAYVNAGMVIEETVSANGRLADPARKMQFFSLWR
jgi:cell wall-associated NlpC family hydrolase